MMSMQICVHDRHNDPCSRMANPFYGNHRPLMVCTHRETVPLRYIGTGTHRCVDPLSVCVYRPVAEIENEAFVCATAEQRALTTRSRLEMAAALIRECRDPDLALLLDHIERKAMLVGAREFTRRFGPVVGDE